MRPRLPAAQPLPSTIFDRTAVIIPAYNEAKNIALIVKGIKSDFPAVDLVVIDDGSADGTREIAAQAGATVLSHTSQMGYGVALQTGYKYALGSSRCEYLVQIDGDGQHNYRDIPRLLEPLLHQEADLVIGSRFSGKRASYRIGLRRRAGMTFFRMLFRIMSKTKIQDVTSGMKAFKKKVIENCVSDEFPYHYPDTNVLLLHSRNGFRIVEVPSAMKENKDRKSMHGGIGRQLFYLVWMILSLVAAGSKTKGGPHAR